MIHHLARAFHVRENALAGHASEDGARPASEPAHRPIKPRPLTPWHAPQRGAQSVLADFLPLSRVRISTDPSDARRTVITGRFGEVCAALDRLVREQEAAA